MKYGKCCGGVPCEGVAKCPKCGSENPLEALSTPISSPLSTDEIRRRRDADNFVTGVVRLDLADAIDNDLEGWLDIMSEALTGSSLLMDIGYEVVGFEPRTTLHVRVTGDVSGILEDDDEYPEDVCECGSRATWVPTYCNHGHCATCFQPKSRQHECSWNGKEHESFRPCARLPGLVCACEGNSHCKSSMTG